MAQGIITGQTTEGLPLYVGTTPNLPVFTGTDGELQAIAPEQAQDILGGSSITATYPVADGQEINQYDVVDVVNGKVQKTISKTITNPRELGSSFVGPLDTATGPGWQLAVCMQESGGMLQEAYRVLNPRNGEPGYSGVLGNNNADTNRIVGCAYSGEIYCVVYKLGNNLTCKCAAFDNSILRISGPWNLMTSTDVTSFSDVRVLALENRSFLIVLTGNSILTYFQWVTFNPESAGSYTINYTKQFSVGDFSVSGVDATFIPSATDNPRKFLLCGKRISDGAGIAKIITSSLFDGSVGFNFSHGATIVFQTTAIKQASCSLTKGATDYAHVMAVSNIGGVNIYKLNINDLVLTVDSNPFEVTSVNKEGCSLGWGANNLVGLIKDVGGNTPLTVYSLEQNTSGDIQRIISTTEIIKPSNFTTYNYFYAKFDNKKSPNIMDQLNFPVSFIDQTNKRLDVQILHMNRVGDISAGPFANTSHEAVALNAGSAGTNVKVAYQGTFKIPAIVKGTSISTPVQQGLKGFAPIDGFLNILPYWGGNLKCASGSYVGTNTYGSTNRNIVYLGFAPLFGYIRSTLSTLTDYYGFYITPNITSTGTIYTYNKNINYTSFIENENNEIVGLNWHSISAEAQLNSNTTYVYTFFGV